MDSNFSMLTSQDLLSKPVDVLKAIVKDKRVMSDKDKEQERKEVGQRERAEKKSARGGAGTSNGNGNGGASAGGGAQGRGAEPMDEDGGGDEAAGRVISPGEVTVLDGHTSEVFIPQTLNLKPKP